jgi:hypothetical protein
MPVIVADRFMKSNSRFDASEEGILLEDERLLRSDYWVDILLPMNNGDVTEVDPRR